MTPSQALPFRRRVPCLLTLVAALAAAGCDSDRDGDVRSAAGATEPPAVPVATAPAIERPITRFIRVTGTLTADEQADVAAEIAGRIVATPVERGTRVGVGADLVRIASTEVDAQAKEAEANAAQIEARLNLPAAGASQLDLDRVPEVATARAQSELAQTDFERARRLFDDKLLSQSEFDQRRGQSDVLRRQYDIARSGAVQQYQALLAARARVALARKALADTVVRAPFAGVVAERLVSVGDYVTRGTKVASVMRTNPLRVELTIPEQYIGAVEAGRAVSLAVDAYPGRTFRGRVRYVSPALRADTRALVVEAVVPNDDGALKPGFFVTARVDEASPAPAILVPAGALRTTSGTTRVFVIADQRAEERIVTIGQSVDALVEIASGLKAGDVVATTNVERLTDGAAVVSK